MNILIAIKWAGNVAIAYGAWQIGNKWRPAFIFSFIGELIWIIAAFVAGDYALAAICSMFSAMAVRSFIKWR